MNPKVDVAEKAKKAAALAAVKHVKDGFVVGLGSGSTAAYAIEEIGKRIKREKIRVWGVPTSYQALMLAAQHGIPLTTLEEHPLLNVTIDGADQVDKELNLIKGMGGALTREKIIASASKKNIVVVDESKKVRLLGEKDQPVPTEVLPFSLPVVMEKLKKMGGDPVLREGKGKVGPIVTDNGNFLLDVHFGLIHNAPDLARNLKAITGVIETGLFIEMASTVYVGKSSGVEKLERK